jgi:RNA polymerase sigma factor (sigma-70 family)
MTREKERADMAAEQSSTLVRHIHRLAMARQHDKLSDKELLALFATRHDETAFAMLVRRHGGMVLRVAQRVLQNAHDAEDVCQAAFLLLARKAAAPSWRDSLASWLHGVAYRLALKVREAAWRRQARERRAAVKAAADPLEQITARELLTILDDELARLPEKYRAPLVLHYLEGHTQEAAARRLGWPLSTFKVRLGQARATLRRRLRRRHLLLSAVLSSSLLADPCVHAALPVSKLTETVHAAGLLLTRKAIAGVVAAPVVALVDKGLPAMFMTKLPIALGLALTGLLVGAGLFLQGGTGAQPKAAQDPPVQGPVVGDARSAGAVPAAAAPGTPLGQNTSAVCVIRGRVLDPAGKPVAGAKLYRAYSLNSSIRPLPQAAQRTASGPDGRFEFVLSATELALGRQAPLQIAAAAEGYGPDWFEMTGSNAPRDLTFCLSRDDVPIQGRIVNLEGLPIRGVSVTVLSIAASQNDNLADLVRALTDKRQVDLKKFLRKGLDGLLEAPGIRAHATTDKDGRFHLHGIGRERVAMLLLGGSPVAADLVMVMTRPGQRYFVPDHPGSDMIFSVYGATFQHAAAPARPILGKVQDRNSGKPLPGVRVRFDFEPNDTLTDRNGHYRIDSIPRFAMSKPTDKLLVTATAPADQPYLVAIKELEPQGSAEPITLNFELKKGVWVQGRVTDKETGKPVAAEIEYYAFRDNPNLRDAPDFAGQRRVSTALFRADNEGRFRVPALPGPGLMAAHDPAFHYLSDQSLSAAEAGNVLAPFPFSSYQGNIHGLARINPARGEPVTCNLVLDPGTKLAGKVVGPDKQLLTGVEAFGVRYGWTWNPEPLAGAEFTLEALRQGKKRGLIFIHAHRHLARLHMLQGDEKGPVTVQLQPAGSVSGRLLDDDGQPRPDVALQIYFQRQDEDVLASHRPALVKTGADGRFRLENLVPGLVYQIIEIGKSSGQERGVIATGIKVRSAETKDLHDVRLRPFGS